LVGVQVGSADAAVADLDDRAPWRGLGIWKFSELDSTPAGNKSDLHDPLRERLKTASLLPARVAAYLSSCRESFTIR
jgi:hypothetical protein